MTRLSLLNQVPLSQPRDSRLSGITPACSGFGGHWIPILKTVIVHQSSKITTITVVMIMICTAFWLDS